MTSGLVHFVRHGRGVIGRGEVTRTEFSGPDQLVAAAEWWRTRALGDDAVTFGTFAFDPATSAADGVLLVPAQTRRVEAAPTAATPELPRNIHVEAGNMSAEAYTAAVGEAVAAIRDGAIRKVVLARDVVVRGDRPFDPAALLAALDQHDPRIAVFGVDDMIGASPETLIRVRDGRFRVRVLAGTGPVGAADALLASGKDRDEHAFAVTSVLDSLRGHVRDVEAATIPFALELPTLTHLATDISGRVADDSGVLDLVAALHPTAAVAGTPTAAALALIRRLERADRRRYAGPVGWVDGRGDGEFAIALRCARLEPDGALRAFAGAGVVAGSEPGAEFAETELKLRPILDAVTGQAG